MSFWARPPFGPKLALFLRGALCLALQNFFSWWCPPDCTSSNAPGASCCPESPRSPLHPRPLPALRDRPPICTLAWVSPDSEAPAESWVVARGWGSCPVSVVSQGRFVRAAPGAQGGAAREPPAELGLNSPPGAPRAPLGPAHLQGEGALPVGRRQERLGRPCCCLACPPCPARPPPRHMALRQTAVSSRPVAASFPLRWARRGCSERCPLQAPLFCL